MHGLAYNIGSLVLDFAILFIIALILAKSPLLRWLAKFFFIAFISLSTPIITVAGVFLNLSNQEYGLALLNLLVGGFVSLVFIVIFPELKKMLKKENRNFKVWEKT